MSAKNRISLSLLLLLIGGFQGLLANNPNFSLQNISGKAIWVNAAAIISQVKPAGPAKVLNNEFYDITVENPLNVPIGLTISDENNKNQLYKAVLLPKEKKTFTNWTMYVTWDGTRLYPQGGSAGKTEKGYPLDNNVKESEIEIPRH